MEVFWPSTIVMPVNFPFTVTLEGIFNKTINAASISDWSIQPVEGSARWNGFDNRPIFLRLPCRPHQGLRA